MSKNKIYYIRPNHTGALPTNLLFLDVETKGENLKDGTELHRMYMGYTWHLHLDAEGKQTRSRWEFHTEPDDLYTSVLNKCQAKKPLYLLGSNVTFDLFASGLAERLQSNGWQASLLYDKGLVTIIILKLGGLTLKILALQNFLAGSVAEWGKLLNLQKQEINLQEDTYDDIKEYCKRDVEITGKTFLSYLGFLRANNMGGFSPTLSGQSFRAFRHTYMKEKILHYDVPTFNTFIRAGYFGGRTDCGLIGQAANGPFTKVDINSMYPSLMSTELYPTKIRQWVQNPSIERIQRRIRDHCIAALCRINTNQAAYAVKENGRLIFPVGRFDAYLSSGSLRYALEQGHIESIHQAAIFYSANLFKGYIEHFYKLRQKYKAEGNGVWEQTAKLLMNSLYGKFGERRAEELVNTEADPNDFFMHEWSNPETGERGIEWSAFSRYVREGGDIEGPQSCPAIAAHVTDYGRIKLWEYINIVGQKNVLYVDTDSLIIPTDQLYKLKSVLDDTKLGMLKVEGQADVFEVRNCKDYTFGQEIRRKGVRESAYNNADHSFTQARFSGLHSLLRSGTLDNVPIKLITKRLTHTYDKGQILPSGQVIPHRLDITQALPANNAA